MKYLLLSVATLLSGCAVSKPHVYTPPSSIAVFKAVQGTKEKVAEVKRFVRPEGATAVKQLEQKVGETQTSLDSYVAQVDVLTSRAMKAENDSAYWQSKHYQDLKIIWRWRLLALAIVASVAVYIGVKTSWKFFL
jgi:anti-sigma-K factor RskA